MRNNSLVTTTVSQVCPLWCSAESDSLDVVWRLVELAVVVVVLTASFLSCLNEHMTSE